MQKWNLTEKIALGAFLFWAACGLAFAPFRVLPSHAHTWGLPGWLASFVHLCLAWGDVVLIVLAAVNAHLAAVRQWGRKDAVRWGAIVIIVSGAVETIGTLTGYPFGSYTYTDAFGPRMFGILPITIPLAWLVVMTSFLLLVRQLLPFASRRKEAVIVALLAMMFDFVLEPFAVFIKQYWIWAQPNPIITGGAGSGSVVVAVPVQYVAGMSIPMQNYVSWWFIAFIITMIAAPTTALRWGEVEARPAILIICMLAIFGVTRLAHGI